MQKKLEGERKWWQHLISFHRHACDHSSPSLSAPCKFKYWTMDADRLVGGEAEKPRSQQHIVRRCEEGRCQISPLLPVMKGLPEALCMATFQLKSTSNQSPSAKGVAQLIITAKSIMFNPCSHFWQFCEHEHVRRPPAMFPSSSCILRSMHNWDHHISSCNHGLDRKKLFLLLEPKPHANPCQTDFIPTKHWQCDDNVITLIELSPKPVGGQARERARTTG